MKNLLAVVLLLAAVPCALAQAAPQQPPAPATVKVRGAVAVIYAVPGKHGYGRGKESPLAIANGAGVIIVAGTLTKKQAEQQGLLRVAGKLRLDEAGAVLVEAVKVEQARAK